MHNLHLLEIQDSQEARFETNRNKGVSIFRRNVLSKFALVLGDNLDGLVVFTDELIDLLHGIAVPHFNAVIFRDRDKLACHLVVGQIGDVVHVRAHHYAVVRVVQI